MVCFCCQEISCRLPTSATLFALLVELYEYRNQAAKLSEQGGRPSLPCSRPLRLEWLRSCSCDYPSTLDGHHLILIGEALRASCMTTTTRPTRSERQTPPTSNTWRFGVACLCTHSTLMAYLLRNPALFSLSSPSIPTHSKP